MDISFSDGENDDGNSNDDEADERLEKRRAKPKVSLLSLKLFDVWFLEKNHIRHFFEDSIVLMYYHDVWI